MDRTQEARESARQSQFEEIKRKVNAFENNFWAPSIHHMFIVLLTRHLAVSKVALSATDTPGVSVHTGLKAFNFYCEVLRELKELRLTTAERNDILAKLLVWATTEFARPYQLAFRTQKARLPRLVSGTNVADPELFK